MTGLSTTLEDMQTRNYAVTLGRDSERAFVRAVRHSRHVRMLRVALPVAIALIVGGIVLATWLDPLRMLARLPTDAGKLVISGTKITMEAPKITGYTRDSRWYEMTARSASQDITNPNLVELHDIRANMETEDKSTMNVSAAEGTLDRKAGLLTLTRDIVMRSTGGFDLYLEHAVINTVTGELVSERPVELHSEQGTVNAQRFEFGESGETVRFDGGVVMNLPAGAFSAGPAAADKP
jgi:lipopolysaccharide export system protein LptC